MRWMMVLETIIDIKLALLNSNTDKVDLLLNRADIPPNKTQSSHNLSISSIIWWRQMSSLRRGNSGRKLKLNWKRLRSFVLTFMPQLGIRLHKCLSPKRILHSHPRLRRDVSHKLETELHDQACKRKPC
jgi:hypothetical protein